MVADGVGKADHIQPANGHPLPVMGRSDEAFDQTLVGVGCLILLKVIDFVRRRGKAGQVERQTPNQGSPVGDRSGLQLLLGQACPDQPIDGPWTGQFGRSRRDRVRPMALVFAPVANPPLKDFLFPGTQRFVGLRRRHLGFRIAGQNPADQLTLVGMSGHDGYLARLGLMRGRLLQIKAETSLDLFGIRPVTGETMVREDGTHLGVEVDLARPRDGSPRLKPGSQGQESQGRCQGGEGRLHRR